LQFKVDNNFFLYGIPWCALVVGIPRLLPWVEMLVNAAGILFFMNQYFRSVAREREKKKNQSSISVHFLRELEQMFK